MGWAVQACQACQAAEAGLRMAVVAIREPWAVRRQMAAVAGQHHRAVVVAEVVRHRAVAVHNQQAALLVASSILLRQGPKADHKHRKQACRLEEPGLDQERVKQLLQLNQFAALAHSFADHD